MQVLAANKNNKRKNQALSIYTRASCFFFFALMCYGAKEDSLPESCDHERRLPLPCPLCVEEAAVLLQQPVQCREVSIVGRPVDGLHGWWTLVLDGLGEMPVWCGGIRSKRGMSASVDGRAVDPCSVQLLASSFFCALASAHESPPSSPSHSTHHTHPCLTPTRLHGPAHAADSFAGSSRQRSHIPSPGLSSQVFWFDRDFVNCEAVARAPRFQLGVDPSNFKQRAWTCGVGRLLGQRVRASSAKERNPTAFADDDQHTTHDASHTL